MEVVEVGKETKTERDYTFPHPFDVWGDGAWERETGIGNGSPLINFVHTYQFWVHPIVSKVKNILSDIIPPTVKASPCIMHHASEQTTL
jgi:hypothetical protein